MRNRRAVPCGTGRKSINQNALAQSHHSQRCRMDDKYQCPPHLKARQYRQRTACGACAVPPTLAVTAVCRQTAAYARSAKTARQPGKGAAQGMSITVQPSASLNSTSLVLQVRRRCVPLEYLPPRPPTGPASLGAHSACPSRRESLRSIYFLPRQCTSAQLLTAAFIAPVHVELAPRRREPVTISRRRGCAGRCGGEVRPGHGGGVVDEQVLEDEGACRAEKVRRKGAAGSRDE